MSFYDITMSPIEFMFLNRMRKNIIPQAKGDVLEIGFGTGANVSLYNRKKIDDLFAIDIKLNDKIKDKFKHKIKLIEASAEALPFSDKSFDTVISTISLCSVNDLDKTVKEIKRVLKDNGQYLFVEHVLPENKTMARFFHRVNKLWSTHMGGCNINRDTISKLKEHGFEIEELHKRNAKIFIYGKAIKIK